MARAPKLEAMTSETSEILKFEVPVAMREMAEKGVAQAKDAYAKMKAAAEETTGLVEGSYASATKGAADFGMKMIEIARANANSAFDFAQDMLSVKTVSQAVELQTAFVRKQFETNTAQAKEIGEMVQKLAQETSAPFKAQMDKALRAA